MSLQFFFLLFISFYLHTNQERIPILLFPFTFYPKKKHQIEFILKCQTDLIIKIKIYIRATLEVLCYIPISNKLYRFKLVFSASTSTELIFQFLTFTIFKLFTFLSCLYKNCSCVELKTFSSLFNSLLNFAS